MVYVVKEVSELERLEVVLSVTGPTDTDAVDEDAVCGTLDV